MSESLQTYLNTKDNASFKQLITLLHNAPQSELDTLVQQAEKGLEDWPDELRELSFRQLSDAEEAPAHFQAELRLLRELSCLAMKSEEMPRLFDAIKQSTNMTHLDISGKLGRGGFKTLMELPELASLRSLVVKGQSNTSIKAVFSATHLDQLRTLRLENGKINSKIIALFRKATHLHQLEELSLDYNKECGDDGAMALATDTPLHQLKVLGLRATLFTDEGMQVIFAQEAFGGVEHLEMTFNEEVGDASMRSFANAPHWNALRILELSETGVRDAGIEALAEAEHLTGLEALSIRGNQLTDVAAKAIAASPVFSELRYLDFNMNRLTTVGLASLLDSPHLQKLKWLGIGNHKDLYGFDSASCEHPLKTQLNERGILPQKGG
ncbi:MAG TPA: hypothetical protein DCE42_21015, partial [Myxococcales bacterium]|nr:hypothetical protein [Myxococcales bacterium]